MASPVLKMAWFPSSGGCGSSSCFLRNSAAVLQLIRPDCRKKESPRQPGLCQTPALPWPLALETSCPGPVEDRNNVLKLEMLSGCPKGRF